ncbi:hypothetical protein MMC06_003250 [Schaereria dolodes]|nr:hypothetical protein [Schaereria dolodes]
MTHKRTIGTAQYDLQEPHQKRQKMQIHDSCHVLADKNQLWLHPEPSEEYYKQSPKRSAQNTGHDAALSPLTSKILQDGRKSRDASRTSDNDTAIPASNGGHVHRLKQPLNPPFILSKNRITDQPPELTPMQTALPKLPPITDWSLANLPFTHRGTIDGNAHATASYERLEFLGDAYIELIATRLIFPRFSEVSAGKLSMIRQTLVQNETLASYSLAYGFDERAHLPDSFRSQEDHHRKLWIKVLGDIFEAYVAAVILSDPLNGFRTAELWLTELWSPKLLGEQDTLPLDLEAKQNLSRKVMSKYIKVEYRDKIPPTTGKGKVWYCIGVYFSGWTWENHYLGSGEGSNRKEAGARAAMDALSNPLVAQIAAVKREHDAKTREQNGLGLP